MKRMWMGVLAVTAATAGALPTPVAAQTRPVAAAIPVATDAPLPPASARRSIATPSGTINYTVEWYELPLAEADGRPLATISATSYIRDGAPDPRRPVVVLFNGGPGASSSPLHFSAFGPRRLGPRDAAGNRQMGDNPDTLFGRR